MGHFQVNVNRRWIDFASSRTRITDWLPFSGTDKDLQLTEKHASRLGTSFHKKILSSQDVGVCFFDIQLS